MSWYKQTLCVNLRNLWIVFDHRVNAAAGPS